ncbi:DUF445 domain-containing protein [Paenibacillus sp. CN-4]|uniref:DUF445 domain-containing protein n=1 Tax=Paenibacillus nanchangensis TaxID=3348343 RepID=UPI00397903B1
MNSKYLAALSLAFMACGFIVTLLLPESTVVLLLLGGFEAGLVGGLADWFAVTALFRHPMGIPIPHTSLLLKNRDKIVRSLITAMETELLNKESIGNRLRSISFLPLAGSMLTRAAAKKATRRELLGQAAALVRKLPADSAVPYVQTALAGYVREADIKGMADNLVTRLIEDGKDEAALNYVLGQALEWADRPETKSMLGRLATEKLSEVKLGGLKGVAFQAFVGFMEEDKLGELLQGMVRSAVADFLEEDSTYRADLLREIRIRIFQFAGEEGQLEPLREWGLRQLEGEEAAGLIASALVRLQERAAEYLEEDARTGGRALFKLYAWIVRRIGKETVWLEETESRIRTALVRFVEANHYRIGQLVKENLDKMDDASLVSMLEEKIGKDLQWIRVNGALCGFLVGIVLTAIQLL